MPIREYLKKAITQHGRKKTILRTLVLVLPLSGLWFVAHGGYIHAKAILAQILLEAAWSESIQGQKEVKPWPWADTWPVARLEVPGLGINRIVLAGANGSSLAFGPGRLFTSSEQQPAANTLIAGHRDTHFGFLRHLRKGDLVMLHGADGRTSHYIVYEMVVVDQDNNSWLRIDGEKRLTLITCYPFNAINTVGRLRYLVLAHPRSSTIEI